MAHRLKIWALKWLPWMFMLWLLSLIALAWGGYALYQANIYNEHLSHKTLQNNTAPDAVFADATYWVKHKDTEKALKLYAIVASSKDSSIRKAAYYNMANIYLRQAYKLLEETGLDEWDKVTPSLAIAKESYRETLRLAPYWMEAKYNYELVLRLAPIIESSKSRKLEEEAEVTQETPPEGWPTIPGFPRGMP
jgi:mxaK protein